MPLRLVQEDPQVLVLAVFDCQRVPHSLQLSYSFLVALDHLFNLIITNVSYSKVGFISYFQAPTDLNLGLLYFDGVWGLSLSVALSRLLLL